MSNSTTTKTTKPTFDPTIHAADENGNPIYRKDGTIAMKRGRKPGSTNGVTITRKGFDVNAISAAYLARVMAAGDLDELTRFSMLKPTEKITFLTTTPEYNETVTAKIVTDAVEKINSILDAAGAENYTAIMDAVRFGEVPV